jgi:hypothetical protein
LLVYGRISALLVLLPLVEHAMRKLCLYLNDCPMRRGVKLDKILRPTAENGTSPPQPALMMMSTTVS